MKIRALTHIVEKVSTLAYEDSESLTNHGFDKVTVQSMTNRARSPRT
ncbi:hypothetical protein Hanom_Chr16g01444721 [Helianthus anomalus]